MLTQNELKSRLHYDHETGLFTAIIKTAQRVKIGDISGSVNSDGYINIFVKNVSYKAHRLVWLYLYGEFPKGQIDHINGIKTDNRLCNLRECTQHENHKNVGIKASNTSGYKGVSFNKRLQKWTARCRADEKRHFLGYFDSAINASIAYERFAKQHHGEFYYCKD